MTVKDNVVCLVGDNFATNNKAASLLGVPLVVCVSHKLHLKVKQFINENAQSRRIVDQVQEVMKKCKKVNNTTTICHHTEYEAVLNNVTRCLSTFVMLQCYVILEPVLKNISAIAPKLLSNPD